VTEIGKSEDDTSRGAQPVTVFVSDPSAEAERVAQALRAAAYAVVDVPLSMLVARVAVQRPKVILVDADADGAMDAVARVRELSETDAIDVVFFGKQGAALSGIDDAVAHEGSGFFARPVDVPALLRKIDALTGGANRPVPRPTTPPPSFASSRPPPSGSGAPPSLPPPSMRSPDLRPGPRATPPPARQSVPLIGSAMELSPPSIRKVTSVQAPLSGELEALLVEAEQRIGGQLAHESMLPSPEEEIEAVLPAEVLASLDEPVDDEEDDAIPQEALGAHHKGNTTGAGKVTTGGGPSGTGAGTPQPPHTAARNVSSGSLPPAPKTHGGTNSGSTGASTTGLRTGNEAQPAPQPRDVSPAPPAVVRPVSTAPHLPADAESPAGDLQGSSESPAPPRVEAAPSPIAVPTVLGPTDAPRLLGEAIAGRGTGVLAFESREGTRRVVLREGDVVTAASSLDEEALLSFLAARGELPRDRVAQLAGKVPAGGRHAGAALVAHGYMRQDQLWTVLRAHAEWVIGRVVALEGGTAGFEADAGGRLRSEPSVFGGSTGAEVFVEVVRRGVTPAEAITRMGGETSRIVAGAHERLTSECALGAAETAWLGRAKGKTIGEALGSAGDPDFAAVMYALVSLGVCDAVRVIGAPRSVPSRREGASSGAISAASPSVDPLDEEAIRARVRARMQLVDEGDYFAVLGVGKDATGYEVKRAFLELRRAFEPSKLLTPGLADLVEDVRKIASVLDEAYEILRDEGRRERYRRAIEAVPR
jgi:hypothetical protein